MAKLNFEVENGTLKATGPNTFVLLNSTDYAARTVGDGNHVEIYPAANPDSRQKVFHHFLYSDITLNSVDYASAELFVEAFNMLCGAKYAYNTKYPENILSGSLDPDTSVATQITALQKGGYVTIIAPSTNTGVIYVGGDDVDNTCDYIEAGGERFMELDDLSKIYIFASTPGDIVTFLGGYKN